MRTISRFASSRRPASRPGFVLLLGLLFAAGCAAKDSGAPIRLGMAGPLKEGFGESARNGAQLAVDLADGKGGIDGRTVELVARDDEGDGAKAAEVAQQFVDDPSIVAVVGHVTSGAMVAAARLYDGHIAAVSPTATAGELTGLSRWVFRVAPSDSMNGSAMAKFATDRGRRRALVLYENDPYGRGLALAFRQAFGGEIVGMDPIDPDGKSAAVFVDWYKQKNPDLIIVAGVEPSGLAVIRAARASGFDPMFLGSDGWLGMPTMDPKTSEGAWLLAPYDIRDKSPAVAEFVTAYRQKYHSDPDGNAALGYDAAVAVLNAIARGGATRAGVREALASLDKGDPVVGATGALKFAETGDPVDKPFRPMRIHDGGLVSAQENGGE